MIAAEIHRKETAHVDCPVCGAKDQFSVAHIIEAHQKNGPNPYGYTWVCDKCRHEVHLKFNEEGALLCGPSGKRRDEDFVLLEITAETLKDTGRVFIVNRGLRKEGRVSSADPLPDEANPRDHDYFFTEHSCNINSFRHMEEILVLYGDEIHNDPHSLFEVVGAVPCHKYGTDKGHINFDGPDSHRNAEAMRAFLVDAGVLPRLMSHDEKFAWLEKNIPRLTAGEEVRLGDLVARKENKPGNPAYDLWRGRDEEWVFSDAHPGAVLDTLLVHYYEPWRG